MSVASLIDSLSDIPTKPKHEAEREHQYVKRYKARFCENGA